MDLYGDILPAEELKSEKDSKSKNWSNSSMNLLQHHLQNRKQQQSKPSNQFKPRQTVLTNSKPKSSNQIIPQSFQPVKFASSTSSLLGGDWNANLEYDPFWPNDYEKIRKERKTETTTVIKTAAKSSVQTSLNSRPLVDAYSDDDDDDKKKQTQFGAAIAPPASLIESTSLFTTSSTSNYNLPPTNTPDTSSLNSNRNVSDVAAKIMAKMGYKEGKGLGKNQQGISQALQVEKTSKNSGVIISNSSIVTSQVEEDFTAPLPNQPANNQTENQESITEIMKNPTKVIMLRNMVGQGEVDADLEPEVREECSKFGEVNNCLIYEVNEGLVNSKRMPNCKAMSVPDDQAVRIFVEFTRVESAIKALVDLNGRYFGGRVVKGVFYDLDKFKKVDLSG